MKTKKTVINEPTDTIKQRTKNNEIKRTKRAVLRDFFVVLSITPTYQLILRSHLLAQCARRMRLDIGEKGHTEYSGNVVFSTTKNTRKVF